MDESNDLLAACFSLDHLMRSATLCARGVSWKSQVQRFSNNRLSNCVQLRNEVLSGTWRPRPVRPFIVTERGKLRRVMPVSMRDRVVERCLCDYSYMAFIESEVYVGSSACLKGRGLHYAINRIRRYLEAAPPGAWIFQFDFHDYFHTIDRARALGMMRDRYPKPLRDIVALSIGGYDGIGLELGSQVCQLTAVWYPTPLDHVMLSMPGLVGYDRYMDDGIAVFENRAQALNARRVFTDSAESMGLSMNPNKTFCNRATHPFLFCKTRITKRSGGVRVIVPKRQTRHSIHHLKSVANHAPEAGIDMEPVVASVLGYLNRGDADLTRLVEGIV